MMNFYDAYEKYVATENNQDVSIKQKVEEGIEENEKGVEYVSKKEYDALVERLNALYGTKEDEVEDEIIVEVKENE